MSKQVLLIVHIFLLATGAALAVWAVVVTVQTIGAEPRAIALQRAVPAAALLGLVLLYAGLLWYRGFRPPAILAFAPSYLCLGIVISSWVAGWAKAFAPATAAEVSAGKVEAVIWLSCTIATAVVLAWYTHRPRRT